MNWVSGIGGIIIFLRYHSILLPLGADQSIESFDDGQISAYSQRRIDISFRLLEIYYLFVEPRKLQVFVQPPPAGLYLKCIGFLS